MNYHFIAIGGSAMHNLALALHQKGDTITGSDDTIFEPSKQEDVKLILNNLEFKGLMINITVPSIEKALDFKKQIIN